MTAPRALVVAIAIAATVGAVAGSRHITPPEQDDGATPQMVLAASHEGGGTVTVKEGSAQHSFPVRSFAVSMERPGDPYGGGGGGSGVAEFGRVSVVKTFNSHTPRLQQWLAQGIALDRVVIALSAGGSYILTDVLVVQVRSNTAGSGDPTDRVDLDYRTIRVQKGGVAFCWNRSLNSLC